MVVPNGFVHLINEISDLKVTFSVKTYNCSNFILNFQFFTIINPLLRNVIKWSDTLLKFYSKCCKIFKVCLTILGHCEVKG